MGELVVLSRPLKLASLENDSCEKHKYVIDSSTLSARDDNNKLVCVTTGNTFLGSNIVKKLLAHGYLVRVTIQSQVDFEELMGEMKEEMDKLESVVVAKMQDMDSLCNAFRGCHAVFHTSSFIDPHGISGYSEQMAFLETEGARNVIEACGKAAYVRRCVFTSSLLASIWEDDDKNQNRVIDEKCWSDEEFCRKNKLWLALGKSRAEKAAWSKAKELKVNLVTICPALLTSSTSPRVHNNQSFLPYLKGGLVMLERGVLATAEVKKVAEAHVLVYEAMDSSGACGRYHCFDKVVHSWEEVNQLEEDLKMEGFLSNGRGSRDLPQSSLSNSRFSTLLLQSSRCKS